MISSGLDASSEGEYRCISDDVNGTVVIQLDVVGMLELLFNMYWFSTGIYYSLLQFQSHSYIVGCEYMFYFIS